jgi:hypothetical protein
MLGIAQWKKASLTVAPPDFTSFKTASNQFSLSEGIIEWELTLGCLALVAERIQS